MISLSFRNINETWIARQLYESIGRSNYLLYRQRYLEEFVSLHYITMEIAEDLND